MSEPDPPERAARHPQERSAPAGSPESPAHDVRSLERSAYAAGSTAPERAAALAALAALRAGAAQDGTPGSRGTPRAEPEPGTGAVAAADPEVSSEVAEPDTRLASTPIALSRPAALIGCVALVALGAVLGGGSALLQPAGNPASSAGSALAQSDDRRDGETAADTYALLDTTRSAVDDVVVPDLDAFQTLSDLRLETLRRLTLSTTDIPQPRNAAYLGRDHSSRICLVLVAPEGEFAKSCSATADRSSEPLMIGWSTTERFGDAAEASPASIGIRLAPDGSLSWTVSRIYRVDDEVSIVDFDQYGSRAD